MPHCDNVRWPVIMCGSHASLLASKTDSLSTPFMLRTVFVVRAVYLVVRPPVMCTVLRLNCTGRNVAPIFTMVNTNTAGSATVE